MRSTAWKLLFQRSLFTAASRYIEERSRDKHQRFQMHNERNRAKREKHKHTHTGHNGKLIASWHDMKRISPFWIQPQPIFISFSSVLVVQNVCACMEFSTVICAMIRYPYGSEQKKEIWKKNKNATTTVMATAANRRNVNELVQSMTVFSTKLKRSLFLPYVFMM